MVGGEGRKGRGCFVVGGKGGRGGRGGGGCVVGGK